MAADAKDVEPTASMSVVDLRASARALLVGTLWTLGATAVVAAAIAGLTVGAAGALSAVIGVTLVLVLFAGSAALLLVTVERSPTLAAGVLMGGAFVRLALYGATLVGLARVESVHRPSLAIAAGAAVAVTLVQELRALTRTPSLFWVDASATDRPVPSATRS